MTVITTGTTLTTAFKVESDLNGNLVIKTGSGGTTALTVTSDQKVVVPGLIESTSGGFKFPDGSTQTAAATGAADFIVQSYGIV